MHIGLQKHSYITILVIHDYTHEGLLQTIGSQKDGFTGRSSQARSFIVLHFLDLDIIMLLILTNLRIEIYNHS